MTERRDVQCKAGEEGGEEINLKLLQLKEGGEEVNLDELIDSIAGKAGEGGPGGKVSCW